MNQFGEPWLNSRPRAIFSSVMGLASEATTFGRGAKSSSLDLSIVTSGPFACSGALLQPPQSASRKVTSPRAVIFILIEHLPDQLHDEESDEKAITFLRT